MSFQDKLEIKLMKLPITVLATICAKLLITFLDEDRIIEFMNELGTVWKSLRDE